MAEAYKLYRRTTLGTTLQDTLDYLTEFGDLNPNLAADVLEQFDRSISRILRNTERPVLTFKASKLDVYRFCDRVWILMFKNVVFHEREGRDRNEVCRAGTVKVVACEANHG